MKIINISFGKVRKQISLLALITFVCVGALAVLVLISALTARYPGDALRKLSISTPLFVIAASIALGRPLVVRSWKKLIFCSAMFAVGIHAYSFFVFGVRSSAEVLAGLICAAITIAAAILWIWDKLAACAEKAKEHLEGNFFSSAVRVDEEERLFTEDGAPAEQHTTSKPTLWKVLAIGTACLAIACVVLVLWSVTWEGLKPVLTFMAVACALLSVGFILMLRENIRLGKLLHGIGLLCVGVVSFLLAFQTTSIVLFFFLMCLAVGKFVWGIKRIAKSDRPK